MKHGLGLVALLALACSSSPEAPNGGETPENGAGNGGTGGNGAAGSAGSDDGASPGEATIVAPTLQSATLERITSELARANAQTSDELLASYPVSFQPSLGYDPLQAAGLDLIQASAVGMNDAELARYAENGFVVLPRVRYPSMPYGYIDVYAADLPVFVSADMVLEAVHRSFDSILKQVESIVLVPHLASMLTSMRARLGAGAVALSPDAAADADLFVTLALSLLEGRALQPVTTLDATVVKKWFDLAVATNGSDTIELFGARRQYDFSQFEPRGHYEDQEDLQRYFRAMMWLGRTDFRLLETQSDGTRRFMRRQLEAALALRSLMDQAAFADWKVLDRGIGAFVGEHDYMIVPELDRLLADIGRSPEGGLGDVADDVVAQAILDGQYGEQRILSQILIKDGSAGEIPFDASFAFLGQRYTVDSHVFSNVVYDRVRSRVLPDPLDAAFAALGNDQAGQLLRPQLEQHGYAGKLSGMRTLIDAQPAEYWQSSLYTSWVAALRTLSPGASGTAPDAEGLPAVARGEAWSRRVLSTQLASWAQLRHDTILYAKQSYTVSSVCEFPDAYVEPYPDFFFAIARYAELGRTVVTELDFPSEAEVVGDLMATYFENTARIATLLGEMAEAQRTGMPHTTDQIAFINQAIRVQAGGSGPPLHTGWYKDLYFLLSDAVELDPTIADVHTDPGGDSPPREASVLHVGTGYPRPIIVSVDTCVGPRAYAGVVSAYHEHLEPGLSRLTDSEWLEEHLNDAQEVPWLAPVLGGPNGGDPVRYPTSPPDPSGL